MDKLIKAFDELMADSIKNGISIFKNPRIEHFIILCQEDLSKPEAYQALERHIQENEDIFLSHMKTDSSETLSVNLAVLKLRHFILNRGKDALSRIHVV